MTHSEKYYKCFVPDSCCNKPSNNCAKRYYDSCTGQNDLIQTKGCLQLFMKQLVKDVLFLAAFTVCVSSLAIILWLIHVILYFLIIAKK